MLQPIQRTEKKCRRIKANIHWNGVFHILASKKKVVLLLEFDEKSIMEMISGINLSYPFLAVVFVLALFLF